MGHPLGRDLIRASQEMPPRSHCVIQHYLGAARCGVLSINDSLNYEIGKQRGIVEKISTSSIKRKKIMYHIGTLLVKIICEIRFFYVSRSQKQILCLSKFSGIINGLWTVVIRGGGGGMRLGGSLEQVGS